MMPRSLDDFVLRHLTFQRSLHQALRQLFQDSFLTKHLLGLLAFHQLIEHPVRVVKLCHDSLLSFSI